MQDHRGHKLFILLAAFECCRAFSVFAGGGPQNVLVVVNDQSIESLEIGRYYEQERGIPERNICHISVDPLSYTLAATHFQTAVIQKIDQHISTHGLSNQIDYIVFSKDIASRVADREGSTAVRFYGFKNAPLDPPCQLPASTESFYYHAERSFRHEDSYSGTNYYLSTMLTATNLQKARLLVDRSLASDNTAPSGTFYVLKSVDLARNVRYTRFANYDFHARFLSPSPERVVTNLSILTGASNVLGHLTGISAAQDKFGATNVYSPGALTDHLTSYGARLPGLLDQSTVWDWVSVGSSASYGTVAEPCNYLAKFPDPLVYYWYARGFNMAESYWMSVKNPYRGLFVGDPLMAPYAVLPTVAITNLSAGDCVSGIVTVHVDAVSSDSNRFVGAVDIYIDDVWLTNLVTIQPSVSNVLSAEVAGSTATYVVANDTVYDAVSGLANSINASDLVVRAESYGDRLMLTYTNFGQAGSSVAYHVSTSTGEAAQLTIRSHAMGSNLLESIYAASELIRIQGTANSGDTVRCDITLTNGTLATNYIVATAGETGASVMSRLVDQVNTNPLLLGADGVFATNLTQFSGVGNASLDARTPGPEGYNLFVDFIITRTNPLSGLIEGDSFSDQFNDNSDDLTARGTAFFAAGFTSISTVLVWDTSMWPDGSHEIHAVAIDGSATREQGHVRLPVTISNSAMQCHIVAPTNRTCFELNDDVPVEVSVINAPGSVTQVIVQVEEKAVSNLTLPPYTTSWNTISYGVGEVGVSAFAYDDAGTICLSSVHVVKVVSSPTLDTDGDGMADSWEQEYFGGMFEFDGDVDPDGDSLSNHYEFVADTDPTDSNSFFSAQIEPASGGDINITFPSSTARVYEAQFTDTFSTNTTTWLTASPVPFAGTGATQTWVDDGSETGLHPTSSTERLYRMGVSLP